MRKSVIKVERDTEKERGIRKERGWFK